MKIESDKKYKIVDLLELRRNDMLTVNSEYQRGAVWNENQKKKLIDSVLRGYPLPLIYLHFKKKEVAGYQRDALEIIDGQQRINALFEFSENAFELFDPKQDDKYAQFPDFIKNDNCSWGRKKYRDLNPDDKNKFDNSDIFVVKITTDNDFEARDLFIRLQAGLPLNPQEKRDAWPGGYTEFVLQFGGKPEIPRYRGHDFFRKTLKPKHLDRGKTRHLCAQIGMLFFENTINNHWPDIGTRYIDDYYYKNLDFDINSVKVKKFESILNKLVDLFYGYKGKQILAYEAMHLVLLVNTLIYDYVSGWETNFISAFEKFRFQNAKAKKEKSGLFWDNFAMWTSTQSDQSQTIQKRHQFFSKQMLSNLNVQKKDPNRNFDEPEREIVYFKYGKKCAVCFQEIDWNDLEIHHVKEHQSGGETLIDNAAPVHRKCHPKGNDAILFAEKWDKTKQKLGSENIDNIVNTVIQFCNDKNIETKEVRFSWFPPTMNYLLQRTVNDISISLSINSILDIDLKKQLDLFDNMKIGKYKINFDEYFNNNYGKIELTIPISEKNEYIASLFEEFIYNTNAVIQR